jgi:hypothetical protein
MKTTKLFISPEQAFQIESENILNHKLEKNKCMILKVILGLIIYAIFDLTKEFLKAYMEDLSYRNVIMDGLILLFDLVIYVITDQYSH